MKRLLLFYLLMAFCVFQTDAQQFKWATGGGTTETFTTSLTTEQVKFMCTDPNGNVYAVSQVGGSTTVTADTFSGLGDNNDQNILITSYTCGGQMRWAKLIYSPDQSFSYGIIADSLGHIYLAGFLPHNSTSHTLHIGTDTSISGLTDDVCAIMQFDTTGHFNWLRFVGNNTFSTLAESGGLTSPITVDGSNNVHFFLYVGSGVVITSSITSLAGIYDIAYDPLGTLLSATRLDLDSQWYLDKVIIDPATNKMYVTGETNMSLVSSPPVDTFFAAVFDASRNLVWMYTLRAGNAVDGIAMDNSKHLFFSGACDAATFYFNGDSVSDPGYSYFGVVVKTDSNGHPEWFQHFDGPLGVDVAGLGDIALLPNAKIAAVGTYAGTLHADGSPTDTIAAGLGWNGFMVEIDSSGNLLTFQGIYGDGFYDAAGVVTADRVGNVYIGGQVEDSIWAGTPPIPAYHSIGGNTDFFVMKFGYDCSCLAAPTASFSDTGLTRTLHFSYDGTTTGIDSVVWNYGDGSSDTGMTSVHTYSTLDTYRVCVTVYTECGSDMYCSNVFVPLTSLFIASPAGNNIAVYPNPATDELNISGIQFATTYRLLNVTGVVLQTGTLQPGSNKISTQQCAPGMYVLEMTDTNGTRSVARVVKE